MVEDERWFSHRREHEQEHAWILDARKNMEEARKLASADIDRRLDEMNQLRAQIAQERGIYQTRGEYDTKHDALVQRVQIMETTVAGMGLVGADVRSIVQRLQSLETQLAALTGRMSLIAALSGTLVAVVVTVILKVVNL